MPRVPQRVDVRIIVRDDLRVYHSDIQICRNVLPGSMGVHDAAVYDPPHTDNSTVPVDAICIMTL